MLKPVLRLVGSGGIVGEYAVFVRQGTIAVQLEMLNKLFIVACGLGARSWAHEQ